MLNPTESTLRRLAVAAAALAAVAVYANSLANGFAYDDFWIIETRGLVHQGFDRLPELLTAEYWPSSFEAALYRPLTLLTFAVDWAVWDGRPFGFHLLNVILHAGVSALVTVLLLSYFRWWAALAGGLIFAIHPVHTEAVANVVGRAELLAGAFVLAACITYVRTDRARPIRALGIAAISALYALALGSKESAIVLPALLLLAELPLVRSSWPGWKVFLRRRLPLFAMLGLVALAYLSVRASVIGAPIQNLPDRIFALDDSFGTRLFTMARVWPRYFELLLFPVQLSADYSPAVILPADGLTPLGVTGIVLVGSTLLLAAIAARRAPELGTAVGWAAIALLPVSNLVIMAQIVLAERTLYVPSVAVAMVASLALVAAGRSRRPWIAALAAVWIIGFSVHTIRRNPVWENTNTVFENLRQKHPESSRLLWGVADRYRMRGNWLEAKKWYRRSLEIWPHHVPYLMEYALHLHQRGENEEAEPLVAYAVELRPDRAERYTLLALIRFELGDSDGALAAIDQGLRIARRNHVLHALRANVLAERGDYKGAVRSMERVVALLGKSAESRHWIHLTRYRAAAGDTAGALAAISQARLRTPESGVIDSIHTELSPGRSDE